jgi:UDP-GlcNAc3NAcA epimerase
VGPSHRFLDDRRRNHRRNSVAAVPSPILTVLGARPQFIKAAPVSAALARAGLEEVVVHTGQHFDASMSEVFFTELDMAPPQHNLDVHGGLHGEQTGRMMAALEPIVLAVEPGAVLVYGDTNSTLAGVLVAAKLNVRVAHVEAGLRSFDRTMPEEVNRVVADHLSNVLFAPTAVAVGNLAAEGITEGVVETGDVMYDAALMFAGRPGPAHTGRPYVLVTLHRPALTDDPHQLTAMLTALQQLRDAGLDVLWPLHPRTRQRIDEHGLQRLTVGLTLLPPLGYLEMTRRLRDADVVLTDSGGLQKEAFFHRVPCVTARTTTEWVELVELGWNRLVDPGCTEAVVAAVHAARGSTGIEGTPYGDGHAASRIADILAREPHC